MWQEWVKRMSQIDSLTARPASTLDSQDSKKGVSFEFETEKNKGTRNNLLQNKELNIEL